jgi:hypothetical protein
MSTAQLNGLVDGHCDDFALLRTVSVVLERRDTRAAILLRQRVERLLDPPPPLPQQPTAWYLRPATFAVGIIGTLAVGIAHGAGEEIWKALWLTVQKLFF